MPSFGLADATEGSAAPPKATREVAMMLLASVATFMMTPQSLGWVPVCLRPFACITSRHSFGERDQMRSNGRRKFGGTPLHPIGRARSAARVQRRIKVNRGETRVKIRAWAPFGVVFKRAFTMCPARPGIFTLAR